MVHKLEIYGHVHGRPHQLMSSQYSWPKGVAYSEATGHIDAFAKAFTLIEAVINGEPRRT